MSVSPPEAQAARLLRWYPRAWRSHYAEEFAELLIADITERPRSRARTADVIRGGIMARLGAAGLGGCTLEASAQVPASLTALGCCAAVFASLGAAIWSQLTIGWQWSAPDTAATTAAMVVMSAAMLAVGVLALAAAVPVLWSVGARVARGRPDGLLGPAALVVACAVIMFVGARHFGNGWPGTGGHRPGLVPGGVAAFAWASTLSVSSYWAHPGALCGMSPAQAVALRTNGSPLAMVTVDGGPGYWNPHPGDDPMAMVTGELIPRCRRLGLGRTRIGMMGISMGGYGALLLAEKYPHLIAAVAAISPAIWTSYAQAHAANAGAYASPAAFTADDAVTHAAALARIPVRVAAGFDDPFYPGVRALARVLPAGAVVDFGQGCHTGPFFAEQQPPSLTFLARHLAS